MRPAAAIGFALGVAWASPVTLAGLLAGLVAWGVYLRRGEAQGFWRWLLPARIWGHPSHWIDLQLLLRVPTPF